MPYPFDCTRAAIVLAVACSAAQAGEADWPQFGGPTRDFEAAVTKMSPWPESGPAVIWRRPLGEGYSSVAVAGDELYTMYRDENREVVVALDAERGGAIWARPYDAPIPEYMKRDRGLGPHATPLVTERRIFTAGVRGTLLALDRRTGEILWRRELIEDLDGTTDIRGYAASPLRFEDLLLLPVGGEGKSLVAFRQSDGEIVWQSGNLPNAMSSARLIESDGKAQAVIQLDGAVIGLEPEAGTLLWQHAHAEERGRRNIVLPLWHEDRRLFVSSQRGGTRLLRLAPLDTARPPEELWHTNQVRFHFTSPVRIGNVVYGSSGDFGPIPLTAVSLDDGEVLWRSRAFSRANLVRVGERVLLLDEDGVLAQVGLSPKGMEVYARTQLVDELAWTPPTVVDGRVYVRTRTQILALGL